ncbi:MAG: cytochrome c peroxidase [Kofleriaceae bacterium]|nr:cytochrome c peroxidase [Kofleriaceae bacterium]
MGGCEEDLADPFVPLLEKHANVPDPGPDTSNKYVGDPAAIALGKRFYFDPDFSGRAVHADMLLREMTTPGRAALGEKINVSCNSCHDVARGGADHTGDPPGNIVSFGGGAYDLNGQQSVNSAYAELVYWNGRNDSLWSQIVAVAESHVSVNGSRLRVAWRIIDKYRDEYTAVFPEYPLPAGLDSIAAAKARLEPDGTCTLDNGTCPPDHCHMTYGRCTPRFPLEGRPGFVKPGQLATCDPQNADDILQPYGDAWDCMQLADQLLINRIYVNWAKAIAAYEYTLISRDSPFDRWAAGGFVPGGLGASAERGARLFVGKAACATCHSGPLFMDQQFHQIGVPQIGTYVPKTTDCPAGGWCDCVSDDRFEPTNCLPIGARDGIRKLHASKFRRDGAWSDDAECQRNFVNHIDVNYAANHPEECDGRVKYYALPLTDDLKGAWRTPGLRDIAITGPYMHTGMYATLRDVIVHYNKGGLVEGGEQIGTLDQKIKPLNLSDQEIDDLVAFLETLTSTLDPSITSTPVIPPASAF